MLPFFHWTSSFIRLLCCESMLHQSQKNIKRVGFSSQEAQYVRKCINVKLKKIPLRTTLKEKESPNVIPYGMRRKTKNWNDFLVNFLQYTKVSSNPRGFLLPFFILWLFCFDVIFSSKCQINSKRNFFYLPTPFSKPWTIQKTL